MNTDLSQSATQPCSEVKTKATEWQGGNCEFEGWSISASQVHPCHHSWTWGTQTLWYSLHLC